MFIKEGKTEQDLERGAALEGQLYDCANDLLCWFLGTVFSCRAGRTPHDVVDAMGGRGAKLFRKMELVCKILWMAHAIELGEAAPPKPNFLPAGWRYEVGDDEHVTLIEPASACKQCREARAA